MPAEENFPYTVRVVSGDPRVERLVVDGVGLRRIAGDDGRRRAAQGAGRRRRDGPGDERGDRQVRHPHGHRRRRGPLRRHGLQGHRHARPASPRCRWTSRSRGITTEIMRKALEQARQGRHAHPGQDAGDAGARRAPTSRSTRRASSRSGSRSTRSATSSDPAAR